MGATSSTYGGLEIITAGSALITCAGSNEALSQDKFLINGPDVANMTARSLYASDNGR